MGNKMKAEPVNKVVRGRLAFVNVFKPRPSMNPGGAPKYSVCVMIPKKDPQVKEIQELLGKLVDAEWGPGSRKKLGTPSLKSILRDGEEQEEKYPEFAGHMFLNASSEQRPGVVNIDRDEILSAEDCYSGVEAQVQVRFYTYDNKSKGVSAGLNNVRVIAKLPAFTSREDAKAVAWPDVPRPASESTDGDEMLA